MKVVSLLFFSFLFSVTGLAARETGELHGKVLNEDKSPAPYASVVLLYAADSSFAGGAVSAEDGSFSISGVDFGQYLLRVSLTGLETQLLGPLEFSAAQPSPPVADIIMKPAVQQLGQVNVSALQPLFVQQPGMLIMNVEASAVKSSGSVYELLRKTPGVVIDQNGNITLRGKSGVNIMIDGKQTYVSGEQLKVLLQGMPASNVSRVELITNPSAKYDAEGTAGLINIVTKRNTKAGFNGSVNADVGHSFWAKESAGIRLNYGAEKWVGKVSYNLTAGGSGQKPQILRKINTPSGLMIFDQGTTIHGDGNYHEAKLAADFYPTKTTSAGFQLTGGLNDDRTSNDNNTQITIEGAPGMQQLKQVNIDMSHFINPGAGAYFRKVLDTLGREFTVNADYLYYNTDRHVNYALHSYDESGAETAPAEYQRCDNMNTIRVAVAKADYVHPTRKGTKFEAGVKSSYVVTQSQLDFDELQSSQWVNDSLRSNDFTYSELINAAYLNTSGQWKKWMWQGGLRAEQTLAEGYSATLDKTNTTNYLKLFPNFSLLRPLNEKNSLNFSYSRRISRPAYQSLDPFVFYLDKYTYVKGNPFLRPSFSNNVELTHTWRDMLYSTFSYSRATDAVAQVVLQIDSIQTSYQTSTNIGRSETLVLSETFSTSVTKWWSVQLSAQPFLSRTRSDLNGGLLQSQSLGCDGSIDNAFDIPAGIKAELSAWYQSPIQYGVFYIPGRWALNASVTKKFLRDRLKVSLSIDDIFHTNNFNAVIHYQGQNSVVTPNDDTRVGWLRVSYSFGKAFEKRASGYGNAAGDIKNRAGGK